MKYTEIIDKYLDDEMTPQEATDFREQVKTNPELAREVKLHQLAIIGIQHSEEARFEKSKARMKAIESEIEKETPIKKIKPKRSSNIRWLRAIAASLLLIAFAYFLFSHLNLTSQNQIADNQNVEELLASSTKEYIKAEEQNIHRGNGTKPLNAYQQGLKLFEEEKYEAAIEKFDQAIKEDVNQMDVAKLFKADALYRLDKKDEARIVLESIEKNALIYDRVQNILTKY